MTEREKELLAIRKDMVSVDKIEIPVTRDKVSLEEMHVFLQNRPHYSNRFVTGNSYCKHVDIVPIGTLLV